MHKTLNYYKMKIEAGKFYRLRCGGAVKIENYVAQSPFPFQADGYLTGWKLNGRYADDDETIFDLVAEITEAEYNRIVNGEQAEKTNQSQSQAENALYDTILRNLEPFSDKHTRVLEWDILPSTLGKTAKEIKDLREELKSQAELIEYYKSTQKHYRFEAAKVAMQSLIALKWSSYDDTADVAVRYADALLKALEVKE